jgi:hypothetical protein
MKTIEQMIGEYNARVYGGQMSAHSMSVLREILERGDRENAGREDNHNSPVEGGTKRGA